MNKPFINHIIIECLNCPVSITKDPTILKEITDKFTTSLNLHVVNSFSHSFSPHGLTLVEVLSESHLAIHTWPEFNYLILDLLTCSEIKNESSIREIVSTLFQTSDLKIYKPIY